MTRYYVDSAGRFWQTLIGTTVREMVAPGRAARVHNLAFAIRVYGLKELA